MTIQQIMQAEEDERQEREHLANIRLAAATRRSAGY